MTLVFECPKTHQIFHSDRFDIRENNGVKTDASGNKFLDAEVALSDPCPFCREMHVYHATELACPFGGPHSSGKTS